MQHDDTWPSKIEEFYNAFHGENVSLLDDFYTTDIVFEDPLERIEGRDVLKAYYTHIYQSLDSSKFEFTDFCGNVENGPLSGFWTMTFSSASLKNGDPITMKGASYFEMRNGLVAYHKDIFDTAQMLYKHIPLLGWCIRKIEKRLSHQ